MFRDGMQQRRCLLPASHYFEWEKRQREKIKYAIKPSGSYMLFMAGRYRIEGKRAATVIQSTFRFHGVRQRPKGFNVSSSGDTQG